MRAFCCPVFILAAVVGLLASNRPAAAQTPCTSVTLSKASADVAGGGANGSVTVATATPDGCRWTATTNDPAWLTISFGSFGVAGGMVGYTAAPNSSVNPRTGSITIADKTFLVNQAGASCSFTLSPTRADFSSAANLGSFAVIAPDGCTWRATTAASWITITSDPNGTGSGSVNYSITANNEPTARNATIVVGSSSFVVGQAAGCTVTLSSYSASFPATGGTGTITVITNNNNCDRPAASTVTWITITSGANGSGNGNVGYSVAANTSAAARTGTITIGNATFTVSQEGASCATTLTPPGISLPAAGGPGRVTITSSCAWTAATNAAWIMITAGASGTGNGSLTYTVARNFDPLPRRGTLTIGGVIFEIWQEGSGGSTACSVAISPISASIAAAGGRGNISVDAADGCSWSASTSATWLTLAPPAGTGDGTIVYTAAANPDPTPRSATILVAGQSFVLTQEAVPCTLAVSPLSASFPPAGGSGSIEITTACAWSAASNRNWIAINSAASGTGTGVVAYTVEANSSAQGRNGAITVNGQMVAISQTGQACSVTLSGTSASLPAYGGSGSFNVTSISGCVWTPSSDSGWLKVTWASVGGSGSVQYAADPNTGPAERTGTIYLSGQTFSVRQSAGPVITADGVVNAASFLGGAVSPGLIVTIFGTMLGPAQEAFAELTPDGTAVTTSLAGVRVLFDGNAAPVLYASEQQVSAVVPYAVAGRTATRLQVEYRGTLSNAVQVPMAASAPAIFTIAGTGTGQGAILNQNSSPNSSSNAAQRSQVVMIFATGEGETNPAAADGQLTGSPAPAPRLPVTVWIGNQQLTAQQVRYAGAAPGLVAGVLQVNVQIPANATVGSEVPVVIRVGTASSQPGVTMAIR